MMMMMSLNQLGCLSLVLIKEKWNLYYQIHTLHNILIYLQDGSSCLTNLWMNIFPGIANILHMKDIKSLNYMQVMDG